MLNRFWNAISLLWALVWLPMILMKQDWPGPLVFSVIAAVPLAIGFVLRLVFRYSLTGELKPVRGRHQWRR